MTNLPSMAPTFLFFIPIILFSIPILIIIIINILNPRLLWEKFEKWKATSEPSETFFITRRILSIVALVVLLIFLTFPVAIHYIISLD